MVAGARLLWIVRTQPSPSGTSRLRLFSESLQTTRPRNSAGWHHGNGEPARNRPVWRSIVSRSSFSACPNIYEYAALSSSPQMSLRNDHGARVGFTIWERWTSFPSTCSIPDQMLATLPPCRAGSSARFELLSKTILEIRFISRQKGARAGAVSESSSHHRDGRQARRVLGSARVFV